MDKLCLCHKSYEAEIEEKRSRFIALLVPISNEGDIRIRQAQLKQQHPKASHVCYGFRIMNEHQQVTEGFSDDGEPSGTSGPPILRVLQHHNFINIAVLITRYFGGTKLGTGGLQRAYSQATSAVCNAVDPSSKEIWQARITASLKCLFEDEAQLRRELNTISVDIENEEYSNEGVYLTVRLTKEEHGKLVHTSIYRRIQYKPQA